MSFSPDVLREQYEQHFQLRIAAIRPLAGEVDRNFHLTTSTGEQYLAKVSPPGTDPQRLLFEADIMSFLAQQTLSVVTSVPVATPVCLESGHYLRLQTWVAGSPLSGFCPLTPQVRKQWGGLLGALVQALADFTHPYAPENYRWNPSQTLECRPLAQFFSTEERVLADYFWDRFAARTFPQLGTFPRSINHNDVHPDNLLVDAAGNLCGLIDFGDAMRSETINELAIACAYAGMNCPDPLLAISEVITGYTGELRPEDCAHLLDFITARLLITVSVAAENHQRHPENTYLQVSAAPAWRLLRQLRPIPPALATAVFRAAAGWPPHPAATPLRQWLAQHPPRPVVALADARVAVCDLSVGSQMLGNTANFTDPVRFARHLRRWREDAGADFGVGGYGEQRPIYTTDDFVATGNAGPRWRTTHLGLDVWGPVGTPVYAPLPGKVHFFGLDPVRGGYGHVLILAHETDDGLPFYTLYGHLAADETPWGKGATVKEGDQIARFGAESENGGWPPHLHFQLILDLLGKTGDYPGVAYPEAADVWLGICPEPYAFFPELSAEVLAECRAQSRWRTRAIAADLLHRRQQRLGYSLSVSYAQPLHIQRGYKQYLYDASGRRYLDTVNNVAHVGHEHPAVVAALTRQAAVLNTNSRYLHEELVAFAEELTATLPPELSVVHFVNSGSEANELALRMCTAWSGTRNMLAVEVGYHGNTGRTIDVSSYKFSGKGGRGAPPTTTVLPMPDTFRGAYREVDTAGALYAEYAVTSLRKAATEGRKYGGFICESILSCGGQIVLPPGYLAKIYPAVRAQGGLCIADEVQVGVGRVGKHWWGFELQGVVPDIVTIGKPLGNGHPLGAVVCTPAVAAKFANGMEYFNTFGGNPVSCAVGRAVLRTMATEGLREQAEVQGKYLKTALKDLQAQYPLIGDVRGEGLFLGVELVTPDLAPASAPARYLKNRMRALGFLLSTDGPFENVLKFKPPLCFQQENTDMLVDYLDKVLQEHPLGGY